MGNICGVLRTLLNSWCSLPVPCGCVFVYNRKCLIRAAWRARRNILSTSRGGGRPPSFPSSKEMDAAGNGLISVVCLPSCGLLRRVRRTLHCLLRDSYSELCANKELLLECLRKQNMLPVQTGNWYSNVLENRKYKPGNSKTQLSEIRIRHSNIGNSKMLSVKIQIQYSSSTFGNSKILLVRIRYDSRESWNLHVQLVEIRKRNLENEESLTADTASFRANDSFLADTRSTFRFAKLDWFIWAIILFRRANHLKCLLSKKSIDSDCAPSSIFLRLLLDLVTANCRTFRNVSLTLITGSVLQPVNYLQYTKKTILII